MFISLAQAAEPASQVHESFFSDPETWVAIVFVLVVALIARPVLRGIATALDLRGEKIKNRLDEAERLRSESQELLATYQKKQRDALKEAETIVAQAKAESERITAEAHRELDDLLAHREQQAVDRISQAEAEALREVRNTAIDIAMEATRKLIADNLPASSAAALVDDAIKELPKRLH